MLADSVSTLTNNAMKEVKAFLNTEVFGPSGPTKLYRGELHGVGRLYSCRAF
jgi:hypothetical protein